MEAKTTQKTSLENIQNQKTFKDFIKVPGAVKSYDLFMELAGGKAPWFMLLVYGTAGCGKTHLCEALVNIRKLRDEKTTIRDWSVLVKMFKQGMDDHAKYKYNSMFDTYQKAAYLILDDVGMGGTDTAWAWGEFEEIICYRYAQELPTIITTNLDISQLPDRVVSRFRDKTKGRINYNEANDYRPRL